MASAIINPAAGGNAESAQAHRPSVSVVREWNGSGISTPLGVIARLAIAAAALSLTIAAALSLIVWGVAGSTSSDGGVTAAGLGAAGIAFGAIFRRIKN
jgi:hypothetical protein